MTKETEGLNTKTVSETENFIIWEVEEPDGEKTFHLELNNVTIHFFKEEWEELKRLVSELK